MEEVIDNGTLGLELNKKVTKDKGEIALKGSLQHRVSEHFQTIFECVQKRGGIDIGLFRRITANSNASHKGLLGMES